MEATGAYGKGRVKKEIRWLMNSWFIAQALSGVCSSTLGKTWHRHVNLINGRARAAQVYPPKLVKAILEAFGAQLAEDGEFSKGLNAVGAGPVLDAAEPVGEAEAEAEWFDRLTAADSQIEGLVIDPNTGAELDNSVVAKARAEGT